MGNPHSINISELSRRGMGDVGWEYAASEDQLKIDITEYSQLGYTWTKKTEFTVPANVLESVFKIKVDLKVDNAEYAARAKIYVNGVYVLGYMSTYSTEYEAQEVLMSGIVAGDTVELWLSSNQEDVTAYADNYSINGVSTRKYLKQEPVWV